MNRRLKISSKNNFQLMRFNNNLFINYFSQRNFAIGPKAHYTRYYYGISNFKASCDLHHTGISQTRFHILKKCGTFFK